MKPKDTQIIQAQATDIAPIQDEATALISQAIDKNVPVETMEKLLAMRRELKAEKAKEAYDKSMAEFQAECPTIQKTKEVKNKYGTLIYSYAPIESIVSQVKDALKTNGFSYSTSMDLLDNGVKVCVKVTHTAGHSEETCMSVPLGTKTEIMSQSQQVAAATTFAKRYAFCNAFGILTGDEDNDGATLPQKPSTTQFSKTQEPLEITNEQKTQVILLLNKKGKTMDDLSNAIKVGFKKELLKDLTANEAGKLIHKLESLPDKEEVKEDESEQIAEDVAEGLK